jgi:hypothetical protein
MSNFLDVISGLFKPVADLVDNIHTSTEEKMVLRNGLEQMKNIISTKVLELEGKILDAKASIIVAEAKGESWIQRNWRPITMLTFLTLICLDSFGVLAFRLSEEAWVVLKIGLGGYVVGRSVEKVLPAVVKAMKEK